MLRIEAFQIAQLINIKRFNADFKHKPVVSNSLELFYHLENDRYFCVFSYGIIVFAGFDELAKSELIVFLKKYSEDLVEGDFKEDFVIETKENQAIKGSH